MRPFDHQPTLTGAEFIMRPMAADDFEGLHKAASDPTTWAGHPNKDRYKSEVFRGYFDWLLAQRSTLVKYDKAADRLIGCSRYYTAPDMPDSISIGFTFVDCAYWGGAANFALKSLMLGHAFETFDDVWFHIDPSNIRSQKATAKLGAEFEYDAELALGPTAAPFKTYRLRKSVWTQTLARHKGPS